MDHEILQEVTELVRKQQGGKRGPVWMCGEQLPKMSMQTLDRGPVGRRKSD